MTCVPHDPYEILKGARIVKYVEERWEVYLCVEKDGKHYVLVASAEIDTGNQLIAVLLGPDCEHSSMIESDEYPFNKKWVKESLSPDVIRIARWCWEEEKA